MDAHPAVYNHHMKRVSIEPALHGLTDGADLIQRWGMHVRPACIQGLKTRHTVSTTPCEVPLNITLFTVAGWTQSIKQDVGC